MQRCGYFVCLFVFCFYLVKYFKIKYFKGWKSEAECSIVVLENTKLCKVFFSSF